MDFAQTLPDGRGSPIIGVQLEMDDGQGGDFVIVVGQDEEIATLWTSYLARGVLKGRAYRFRCRVKNSIGWSTWSSPDAYVVAAVSPQKPRAPSLDAATATSMTLRFWIPEDDGGSPLTQFELFINDGVDAHEPATLVTTYTSNALTHTLTTAPSADHLVTGTIYKFRFRSTNAEGNSEFSDTAKYALVACPQTPSAPTVMRAQTSTSQIGIQWSEVVPLAGQLPGQEIHGYIVYVTEVNRALGDGAASQTLGKSIEVYNGEENPDTTQILVTRMNGLPLKAGFDYRFTVKAKYLNGFTLES